MGLRLVHSTGEKRYSPAKKPNLAMVHSAEREILVHSHAVVIQNRSLAMRYPGGIKGFMDIHRGLSNGSITVNCFPRFYDGGYDLLKNLRARGFKLTRDYIYVDTERHLSEFNRKRSLGVQCLGMVDTGVTWLKARLARGAMLIQHHDY